MLLIAQYSHGQTKKQLKIADKFSKTKDDSTFILNNSYVHLFSYEFERELFREMNLTDSVMLYNDPGTTLGPFENDSFYLWYKIKEVIYDTMVRVGNIWLTPHYIGMDSTHKIAKKIYAEAKNGASFDSLCKIHSGDGSNAQFECNLGLAWNDIWVPEFAQAIKKGKDGEILLINSLYGWHVVKILESAFITRRKVITMPLALKKE